MVLFIYEMLGEVTWEVGVEMRPTQPGLESNFRGFCCHSAFTLIKQSFSICRYIVFHFSVTSPCTMAGVPLPLQCIGGWFVRIAALWLLLYLRGI